MLAMKRMIRWAAENNFDRIAWTPGEVQAARYDLSTQIESLEILPLKDGTDKLAVYANGRLMRHATRGQSCRG